MVNISGLENVELINIEDVDKFNEGTIDFPDSYVILQESDSSSFDVGIETPKVDYIWIEKRLTTYNTVSEVTNE